MSIHCIRFRTAVNATLRQWVTVWLTNYQPWAEGDNQPPADVTVTDPQTGDETTIMEADWRFDWDNNSKAVLLGNLVAYSRSYTGFGVIGYHVCEHDAEPPTPCPDYDYGLGTGFAPGIQSGVWGALPDGMNDPRSRPSL